ncbi:unnamed protein product [Ilex paraguariensis]|uniref:Thaumatin-like protein 1b n=1 Tax=Ilex paraguariensis TaxID=185542 RepID=A0ABC8SIJ2_9AQUA
MSAKFTLVNQCSYTVWPGILSGAGTPQLSTTGFALQPGQSNSIPVPPSWSGRLWGRTLCNQDPTGKFTCVTGDCGSGTLECAGAGAVPPATLAEFTLNGAGGLDFYDVSLVDGYNLPMLVVPQGGSGGNCTATGCVVELNGACPSELKVTNSVDGGEIVACKSACEAFGDPKYCCSGAYATPDTCKPSSYSQYFKNACPRAYSYAYDDGTSTFTCASADYTISFCPIPAARVTIIRFLLVEEIIRRAITGDKQRLIFLKRYCQSQPHVTSLHRHFSGDLAVIVAVLNACNVCALSVSLTAAIGLWFPLLGPGPTRVFRKDSPMNDNRRRPAFLPSNPTWNFDADF